MTFQKSIRSLVARGLFAAVFGLALFAGSSLCAAETDAPAAPKLDTGDNGWMLVSSALVLMMTAPGLALFYSGLVRKKNVLGVMMQCVFLMCLMTVIWALWGLHARLWRRHRQPAAKMAWQS